jgi:hypothetical protein
MAITGGKAAGGVTAIVGGFVGAEGAMQAGNASYAAGQVEYHQELERTHYDVKIYQRQMIAALHMQFAQAGGAGVVVGEGSPMLLAMNTLNDLEEDKAQMYRNGAKNAWKYWKTGADQFSAAQSQATGSLLAGIGKAASIMV